MQYARVLRSIRTIATIALAVTLLVTMAACGRSMPTGASPEAKMAIYARQVVNIADAGLTALDQLTEARLATAKDAADAERIKGQTRKAAQILGQVGQAGQQLGTALQVWQAAKLEARNEADAVGRVRSILATLIRLMPQVTEPIDDPAIRAGVNIALQAFSTVFLNITSELPPAPILVPAG
jgi:predicted small lipoprotein YifL